MRIQVFSDLHLEFKDLKLRLKRPDVVVLAGDVMPGPGAIDWIREQIPGTPVVYVAGNHEFYGHTLDVYRQLRERAKGTHIHFLEQNAVEIGDVVFLGTSLWSDFMVGLQHGKEPLVEQFMNDYNLIADQQGAPITWEDTLRLHKQAVEWLNTAFEQYKGRKIVVVTHHAPSALSLDAEKQDSIIAGCYASHLDELVRAGGARYWLHGHIHEVKDYKIGATRVVSNPRGYPFQDTGFKTHKLVVL